METNGFPSDLMANQRAYNGQRLQLHKGKQTASGCHLIEAISVISATPTPTRTHLTTSAPPASLSLSLFLYSQAWLAAR